LLPGLFQLQTITIKVSLNENHFFVFALSRLPESWSLCEIFPKKKQAKQFNVIAYRGEANLLVIEINKDFLTVEKQRAIMGKLYMSKKMKKQA
jgi:predicted TPR repeat methyltransferase